MTTAPPKHREPVGDETAVRTRILDAAFTAFMKSGYAAASTLEIATRARVSKRELYALVGNKQEMLIACIRERARRLQVPGNLPVPHDREGLEHILAAFGAQLLREVTDPAVVAVFRLAIAEAVHAPEVAQTLDSIGREASRAALRRIVEGAQAAGILDGRPAELTEQFSGLLWGTLLVSLLLGVIERPSSREITARAREAAAAFLQLHPSDGGGRLANGKENSMFDHVKFGVSHYAVSKEFFLRALKPLGVAVVSEGPPTYGVELSSQGKASLCLYQTKEKTAHLHLAFTAENRQQVEAFYHAALEAGGKDNGAPGLRPHYHANYFAAFVIGPDGHNIEAVCHEPEV